MEQQKKTVLKAQTICLNLGLGLVWELPCNANNTATATPNSVQVLKQQTNGVTVDNDSSNALVSSSGPSATSTKSATNVQGGAMVKRDPSEMRRVLPKATPAPDELEELERLPPPKDVIVQEYTTHRRRLRKW